MTGNGEATQGFPDEERFGLSQQMRRAAVSVPSNIAEGAARSGKREFANFVSIARGSLSELDTQCLIAVDLGYLPQNHAAFASLDRVSKLLARLYRQLTAEANLEKIEMEIRRTMTAYPLTAYHSPSVPQGTDR